MLKAITFLSIKYWHEVVGYLCTGLSSIFVILSSQSGHFRALIGALLSSLALHPELCSGTPTPLWLGLFLPDRVDVWASSCFGRGLWSPDYWRLNRLLH